MGYTHYWRRSAEIDKNLYKRIVGDIEFLIRRLEDHGEDVPLAGGDGTGKPTFSRSSIWFNGRGESAHETFSFGRVEGGDLKFCKTARKPYDLMVTSCLLIAKKYLRNHLAVTSDGNDEEWRVTRNVCQGILGYGNNFRIVGEDQELKEVVNE